MSRQPIVGLCQECAAMHLDDVLRSHSDTVRPNEFTIYVGGAEHVLYC